MNNKESTDKKYPNYFLSGTSMHKSTCILIITTLYMYEGGSDKPYVVLRLCFCGVGGGGGQEWG